MIWVAVAGFAGLLLGLFVASMLTANTRGDELLELYRLRALERGLGGLELRIIDGAGPLFGAKLSMLPDLWRVGADDGRLELSNSIGGGPVRVVLDEIVEVPR